MKQLYSNRWLILVMSGILSIKFAYLVDISNIIANFACR